MGSNIQYLPAHGVFISQLIRYATVRLSIKLLEQGYVKERLRSSLRTFYGRYGDLIKQYEAPSPDILEDDHLQWHPPLIRHYTNFWPYYWPGPYYRIWLFYLIARGFHRTFTTRAACQQRTLIPPYTWSLSHFGTCECSNVETNLSWTCLLSGLLSFELPSVLLFLLT